MADLQLWLTPLSADALEFVPGSRSSAALWLEEGLQEKGLVSLGSAFHGTGYCKPCAWFWKQGGCLNALDCFYCHMCPPNAIKQRKKAKVAALRAGLIQQRSF